MDTRIKLGELFATEIRGHMQVGDELAMIMITLLAFVKIYFPLEGDVGLIRVSWVYNADVTTKPLIRA